MENQQLFVTLHSFPYYNNHSSSGLSTKENLQTLARHKADHTHTHTRALFFSSIENKWKMHTLQSLYFAFLIFNWFCRWWLFFSNAQSFTRRLYDPIVWSTQISLSVAWNTNKTQWRAGKQQPQWQCEVFLLRHLMYARSSVWSGLLSPARTFGIKVLLCEFINPESVNSIVLNFKCVCNLYVCSEIE